MTIRRRWLGLAAAVVGLSLVWWQSGALWRAAYPHLPARVQGLPYRARSWLPLATRTPVALPTLATGPEVGPGVPADVVTAVTAGVADVGAPTVIVPAPIPAPPTATAVLPAAVALTGVRHEYQRWNNCGPATVAMALSAFGGTVDQVAAARALKPDPDDKNVGPEELADYARSQGLEAIVRANGDLGRLRALLAAGLPVIVETWFVPRPDDEMGHYRLLTGYDDARGVFLAADSYEGPGTAVPYAELDRRWRAFNRTYVLAYPAERAAAVATAVGGDMNDQVMYVRAAATARSEVEQAEDVFGWFNLGTSLLGLGDAAAAATAYDRARELGLPWRMLWYQLGPFAAYAALGRWDDVQALAAANLRNAGNLEESLYWRARARAATGDVAGAAADYRQALTLNPGFGPAATALSALP